MGIDASTPRSLQIVGGVFILLGVLAGLDTILSSTIHGINVNLGVVGILIGVGLLSLRPFVRIFALVVLWCGFVVIPIQILLLLFSGAESTPQVFGVRILSPTFPLALPCTLAALVFFFYAYIVLNRPRVKRLFQ